MLEGAIGAGLLGLALWGSRWKRRRGAPHVWTRKVRGGELSVAPYHGPRRGGRYQVMFFADAGYSIDGGLIGGHDAGTAKERADRWWAGGMPGGLRQG